MPDYANGKIYTIRCRTDDSKIYVGSTIQPLYKRFGGHKKDSRKEKYINCKLYKEVNDDWNNWYIELYENHPCNSKEELCKREGEIIRLIGTLNMLISGRSQIEYRNDNIDRIKEYQKEYREKHKNESKEQRKEYLKQYRIDNADKIKQYQIENADKIKEYHKQYHLKKKEEKLKASIL